MTTLDDRRLGRLGPVLIGLVAWFVLTIVPAFHGHHPTPDTPGSQTDWSCALCAVSTVPELSDSSPAIEAPSNATWAQPSTDSNTVTLSSLGSHRDRAPPSPLV